MSRRHRPPPVGALIRGTAPRAPVAGVATVSVGAGGAGIRGGAAEARSPLRAPRHRQEQRARSSNSRSPAPTRASPISSPNGCGRLPARWVTRGCVRIGITPNQVTAASLVLVIVAGALFARGEFGWGLVAGWIMTFLDTVDGKLARVTVTSTPLGNVFDHGIDLVHPPLWYLAWGIGLALGRWRSPVFRCRCSTSPSSPATSAAACAKARSSAGSRGSRSSRGARSTPGSG